ncbi:MAG: cytochrome BD ubiquinol oxidase subunit II [Micavibrio sp.]|nr:cytochrome BD ubiquinol oxidase subunit II [Micavibrio sp.]|tara:strand:- start:590 stop:1606 length:1017 start_codon:yes stop_codon:yes gene_type:complete
MVIQQWIESGDWLPLVFAFLMGLSMLIYAVLDGYDLGVGILTDNASAKHKDRMIASIGPFWDANETWLVLGVGLLLVAFPKAHGIILTHLYLPVAVMLIGLIFRGVAFDFRAKVPQEKKKKWNKIFFWGSLLTALSQGYMLGSYIIGFRGDAFGIIFSLFIGLCVVAGYCLIGACWLIMKTEGFLQERAVRWAKYNLINTTVGVVLISLVTPMINPHTAERWFHFPEILYLSPIPILTGVLIVWLYFLLRKMPMEKDRLCWAPFVMTAFIFVLCFSGLAYSFYPYIVPGELLIVDAASAPESLMIILVGALIVLPVLFGYTFVAYKIFHGKAVDLKYD